MILLYCQTGRVETTKDRRTSLGPRLDALCHLDHYTEEGTPEGTPLVNRYIVLSPPCFRYLAQVIKRRWQRRHLPTLTVQYAGGGWHYTHALIECRNRSPDSERLSQVQDVLKTECGILHPFAHSSPLRHSRTLRTSKEFSPLRQSTTNKVNPIPQ